MRRLLLAFILAPSFAAAQPAAGLTWVAPSHWRVEPAQSMRAATYTAPPVPGDSARAECAIYFFGKGQGGTVDANIDRWKGQFTLSSGAAAPARVMTRTSRGLTFTLLDTAGNYAGLGGPMGGGRPVPGYRLLGAIVQGPGGNVFIKFTGPERTIGANQLQFEQLLASIQPEK
jgi:hypothetical protein